MKAYFLLSLHVHPSQFRISYSETQANSGAGVVTLPGAQKGYNLDISLNSLNDQKT